MFRYYAWRAGYCIGRRWYGLRKVLKHSWERIWFDTFVLMLRLNWANSRNAHFNPFVILAIGWIIIRCLQGDLDLFQILDDLAINLIASYLYDR